MSNNQNRKWLVVCLIVLGVVTLSITAFLFYIRLEKPIFIKSYYEYNWAAAEDEPALLKKEFIIQYLSNADDSHSVTGIEFPNLKDEQLSFYATESASDAFNMDFMFSGQNSVQSSTVQKVGLYSLHTVRITIQCLFSANERNDTDIILQDALIHFSDGSTQEVNLGKIKLYWRNWNNMGPLSQIQGMSANDGTSEETLRSNETLTVIGLRWMPCIDSAELFKITLNGVDASSDKIKGMEIKKGEIVTLRTEFPEPEDLKNKFTAYELRAVLTVQDNKGVQKEIDVDTIHYNPSFFNTWDILRYALAH